MVGLTSARLKCKTLLHLLRPLRARQRRDPDQLLGLALARHRARSFVVTTSLWPIPPRSSSQLRDGPHGRPWLQPSALPYISSLCNRAADTVQAFREHFRVYARADAEVIGHFEKATRNCGGVEFRPQAFEKRVRLSVD